MTLLVVAGICVFGVGTVIADSLDGGIPLNNGRARRCVWVFMFLALLAVTLGRLGWIGYSIAIFLFTVCYAGLFASVVLLLWRSYLL